MFPFFNLFIVNPGHCKRDKWRKSSVCRVWKRREKKEKAKRCLEQREEVAERIKARKRGLEKGVRMFSLKRVKNVQTWNEKLWGLTNEVDSLLRSLGLGVRFSCFAWALVGVTARGISRPHWRAFYLPLNECHLRTPKNFNVRRWKSQKHAYKNAMNINL